MLRGESAMSSCQQELRTDVIACQTESNEEELRRGCGVQDAWNLPCRMGGRLPRPNLILAVAKLVERDFQFPFEM